jgi:hypothetical protein
MLLSTFARCMVVTALAALTGLEAHAQQTRDITPVASGQVIDWYYAATFGTGVYTIGDRSVFVARVPLGLRLRESDEERWGVRLKLPITFGIYRIPGELDQLLSRENFASVSVLPGVEFERQMSPRWILRPTIALGYGHDLDSVVGARIWEVGVRSLYTVPMRQGDFVLTNSLLYAGSNATTGTTQNLGILTTGLNFILPTGKELLGRPMDFGLHFIHYLYFNRLDFFLDATDRQTVNQQYEIGLSLGTSKPFKIVGFDFDRIGVGFRAGEDFFAIRLTTGYLF